MLRRDFLKIGASSLGLSLLPLGKGAWAAANSAGNGKRLVVVMLRGAVDGLNVVVPYADSNYYELRPTIAIARPGSEGGALDLDGQFGLHPALAPLMPLWQQKSLAFVHASGSPDETRSHFDAQDYLESGTPGVKSTADGWMNRLMRQLPEGHKPTAALSFGPTLPRIFAGSAKVATVPTGRAAERPMALDNGNVEAVFDALYDGQDALSLAYVEGKTARKTLLADLQQEMDMSSRGAPSPIGFAQDTERLARLIRQDPTIQLAFFDLGGWDTHVNQGAAVGQLAAHLKPLAEGLAAFQTALGDEYANTVVVVMSEFGRTAAENGNRGTDHGHGNAMWIMGGRVKGGHVYGTWPGLGSEQLHEARDLAVTTDYRAVLASLIRSHLNLSDEAVSQVFPQMPESASPLTGLVGA